MAARTSNQLIERLQRASAGMKLLVLLIVAAILGGVYYFLFYSDMQSEQERLTSVSKRQIDDEQRLIKRQADYRDLLQQKKDVEERLQKNAIKLPESSELPAFFQHLETQAATANVRVVSRGLEKEIPIENYIKVPVKLEIQGDFYQINNYFKLLSETSRIITIENLAIAQPQRDATGHVTLTAKFTASTFRQSDKPKPVPVKPGAPAPAPAPTIDGGKK
jgi:type IV pilus assembly protein PilO